MSLKAILLIISIGMCAVGADELLALEKTRSTHSTHGQPRSGNFFLDFLLPPVCTGCPPRYCDKDPAIILGYCCGCRRAFDILPVFCSPAIFCPPYIRDVCHDYEYMLHCCC